MNFLIIGTGHISEQFADALGRLGIKPHSVYSRDALRAEEFRTKIGAGRAYSDLDAALADESVEAVYIASPNICHAGQAISALLAKKAVLCEKTLATSYGEYLEMRRCADWVGGILVEAMRPAFDPVTEIIEREIQGLGRIRRASFTFCQYSSRYDAFKSGTVLNAFNPDMKNSALADIGVYPIYFAVRLFGAPTGLTHRSVYLENGFEGAGQILLHYPDMLCDVNYSKIHSSPTGGIIEGERGTLCFDKMNAPRRITVTDRDGTCREIPVGVCENNMIYEIREFIKIVRGEAKVPPHTERSDAVMKIIDMAQS